MRHRVAAGRGSLAALLITLLLPATALGSTAALSGSVLIVTGTAGPETIGVSRTETTVTITSTSGISDPDGVGVDCSVVATNLTCSTLVAGDLVINAAEGDDTINGAYKLTSEDVSRVDGGPGNDTLNAGTGARSFFTTMDTGGTGNDTFTGSPTSADAFAAEPGSDTYRGGTAPRPTDVPATDVVNQAWSSASDRMSYAASGPVTVTLDGAPNDGAAGEQDNVGADIEEIRGGNGNDRLDASAIPSESVLLTGGPGNDVLIGGGGDDDLSGGNGDDVLNGGPGSDWLGGNEQIDPTAPGIGSPGNDVSNGGPGDDAFSGYSSRYEAAGPVTEYGALAGETFNGGDGEDIVYLERRVTSGRTPDANNPSTESVSYPPVTVSLDGAANDVLPGTALTLGNDIEDVSTGSGADTLIGNAGSNVIWGGSGNDTIDGSGGVDQLYGENGVDTITSRDLGFDRVDCGIGADSPVQGDAIDLLTQCEGANSLTALPAPPDTTRPAVKVGVARKFKRRSLRRSRRISFSVTPSEPVLIEARLFTGSRDGQVGQTLLARSALGLADGKRAVRLKLTRSGAASVARRARTRKGAPLTLQVTVTDAAGNAQTTFVGLRVVR